MARGRGPRFRQNQSYLWTQALKDSATSVLDLVDTAVAVCGLKNAWGTVGTVNTRELSSGGSWRFLKLPPLPPHLDVARPARHRHNRYDRPVAGGGGGVEVVQPGVAGQRRAEVRGAQREQQAGHGGAWVGHVY